MPLELSLTQFVGRAVVLLFLGLMLFNGVVMLLWPTVWFRLPTFIALRGTLQQKRTTWGNYNLGVRVLGFAIAAVVLSMLLAILGGSRSPGPRPRAIHNVINNCA